MGESDWLEVGLKKPEVMRVLRELNSTGARGGGGGGGGGDGGGGEGGGGGCGEEGGSLPDVEECKTQVHALVDGSGSDAVVRVGDEGRARVGAVGEDLARRHGAAAGIVARAGAGVAEATLAFTAVVVAEHSLLGSEVWLTLHVGYGGSLVPPHTRGSVSLYLSLSLFGSLNPPPPLSLLLNPCNKAPPILANPHFPKLPTRLVRARLSAHLVDSQTRWLIRGGPHARNIPPGLRCEPLLSEVRRCAVTVLDGAASLFEGAAEAALQAAEHLPVVGGACAIIHGMYRAVKSAKKNHKDCDQFGQYLRGLEAILIKAGQLDKPAVGPGNGGRGESLVPSHTRGSVSLSRGPGRKPGASLYTRKRLSLSRPYLLPTSLDAIEHNKQGFTRRWMTWRAPGSICQALTRGCGERAGAGRSWQILPASSSAVISTHLKLSYIEFDERETSPRV